MKISVVSGRNPQLSEELDIDEACTLADLMKKYRPRVDVNRQSFKLTLPDTKTVTLDGLQKPLSELGVKPGAVLQYKDLGPQISYRTVFVVEYAGPIAMMLLFAARPGFVYATGGGGGPKPFPTQTLLFIGLFVLHFVKRELETFFVHKFSRPTMPLMNIFKNSMYYWSFAAFIGYFLCHPHYTPTSWTQSVVCAGLMGLFELGNFLVHVQLSSMRRADGDTSRAVPGGPLFALVSCPNYTFEVLSWVAFSAGTSIAYSWAFTVVGLLQMTQWALKKHAGYVKGDSRVRSKKSIIPFII